jgi:hypothetical protein
MPPAARPPALDRKVATFSAVMAAVPSTARSPPSAVMAADRDGRPFFQARPWAVSLVAIRAAMGRSYVNTGAMQCSTSGRVTLSG